MMLTVESNTITIQKLGSCDFYHQSSYSIVVIPIKEEFMICRKSGLLQNVIYLLPTDPSFVGMTTHF